MKLKHLDDPTFMQDAYEALAEQFTSGVEFDSYYTTIAKVEDKNRFLRIASNYLFLCKRGDWVVNVPHRSNPVVSYFTNSFKLTVLCALIESVYDDTPKWKNLVEYLLRPENKGSFPIPGSARLRELSDSYNEKFGATRRLRKFLCCLPAKSRDDLLAKFKINGKLATVNRLADLLYQARSSFVHNVEFVLVLDAPIFDRIGKKSIFSKARIHDLMNAFEIGLIAHFSTRVAQKQVGCPPVRWSLQ